MTRAIAAQELEVPPNRISQWVSDGCPVLRRGHRGQPALYDVAAIRVWREARVKETDDSLSLEVERAKLAKTQREFTQLKLDRERRELLPYDQVVSDGQKYIAAVAAKLRSLPPRMVQEGIVAAEGAGAVDSMIEEAISEMAQWSTELELLHTEEDVEASVVDRDDQDDEDFEE